MTLIAPPESLTKLLEPWASYYSDSKAVNTLVTFVHLGALLVGGGAAIAADRDTLRAGSWGDTERGHHLGELRQLHRVVITALIVVVLSGLLMFTGDIETYWGSKVYWTKMLFFVALLVNGAIMRGVEQRLAVDSRTGSPAWARLRTTAKTSIALWLLTLLAGVALMNYA
jgi:hypothetical protein